MLNRGTNRISLNLKRCLALLVLVGCLQACTLPGHRQVIESNTSQIIIHAVDNQSKQRIRFNESLTQLTHLPTYMVIEITADSPEGQRKVVIESTDTSPRYVYSVAGQQRPLDITTKDWLAAQIVVLKQGLRK